MNNALLVIGWQSLSVLAWKQSLQHWTLINQWTARYISTKMRISVSFKIVQLHQNESNHLYSWLILTCMEFDDSLARICIRILYVWQLWVLIDSVVHLVVGFDWNIWKDIEWCMLMPQFELDALFHSELDYNPNKGMVFLEKQVLSC